MASKRLIRSYRKKAIKDLANTTGLIIDIPIIPNETFTLIEPDKRSPNVKSYELTLPMLECELYNKGLLYI
jgi:hypothetical protein